MKKYLGIVLMALVIAGCSSRAPQTEQPATIEPAVPSTPAKPALPPSESQPLPTPPKIQVPVLDWSSAVTPLVGQMVKTDGIAKGSILLLNKLKNNTNGSLQTAQATTALYNALASSGQFTMVSREQLGVARQSLGLSEEDSLESRSKAVGLARYVGAQYVLYADASGDVKSPELSMQLMLVQTGEIAWSGNGTVRQQ
ncbi:Penicillin-binding protein activator LpoB [Dickeya dianthicola]|uniref:Penicillin-binding protein activator LpoB n=1 Tax=Dickeya dianthicola TaxID=204039 RepID=A0AAP6VE88_9GAMM|nr:penicillin-binding protein activator LpoB [Dickeya dianthicola]AYC19532.1 Penicillin-binding protein activator LpoB [Dickeya dianthicola]MBI0437545.1 penicillin-binding protein activator LpoB [Dickeya dianthicola]MBI0447807.1 penicillin-binding protein activator LpoB [Dickeya dianthicola]MBI0452424.1 penicillin-binding protein activator LpoB [Dickeya dianthicola]MBI0456917.1 penicillin-binding protein activator LpoB [Dickeya dianthicola]